LCDNCATARRRCCGGGGEGERREEGSAVAAVLLLLSSSTLRARAVWSPIRHDTVGMARHPPCKWLQCYAAGRCVQWPRSGGPIHWWCTHDFRAKCRRHVAAGAHDTFDFTSPLPPTFPLAFSWFLAHSNPFPACNACPVHAMPPGMRAAPLLGPIGSILSPPHAKGLPPTSACATPLSNNATPLPVLSPNPTPPTALVLMRAVIHTHRNSFALVRPLPSSSVASP